MGRASERPPAPDTARAGALIAESHKQPGAGRIDFGGRGRRHAATVYGAWNLANLASIAGGPGPLSGQSGRAAYDDPARRTKYARFSAAERQAASPGTADAFTHPIAGESSRAKLAPG